MLGTRLLLFSEAPPLEVLPGAERSLEPGPGLSALQALPCHFPIGGQATTKILQARTCRAVLVSPTSNKGGVGQGPNIPNWGSPRDRGCSSGRQGHMLLRDLLPGSGGAQYKTERWRSSMGTTSRLPRTSLKKPPGMERK